MGNWWLSYIADTLYFKCEMFFIFVVYISELINNNINQTYMHATARNEAISISWVNTSWEQFLKDHPVETTQPNGQLAVNCTGFRCTIKCYFLITPEFYRVFFWKVLHIAVNIVNCFCMTMIFSKHDCNRQLSYPDHSRYHNANLHCNLQVFIIC